MLTLKKNFPEIFAKMTKTRPIFDIKLLDLCVFFLNLVPCKISNHFIQYVPSKKGSIWRIYCTPHIKFKYHNLWFF